MPGLPANWFPDPRAADLDGLVAVGGDLSVPRLVAAYREGIFPWSVNPLTWWSPDPRGIFELGSLHVSKSLRRALRRGAYQVTFDQAFPRVIEACRAAHAEDGTWISPEFLRAYNRLHKHGHAHSVETWIGGELVGGVYGVTAGGLFAGESMFHRAADASKVALVALEARLREQGYTLFDIQMVTPVTQQLGAREIPREEYLQRLVPAVRKVCYFV